MRFDSLFPQCVITCPLPKKQPAAVMWVAVTGMSKTRRESTRLKIICRTAKKSKLTVLTEPNSCRVIKDLPYAVNSLLLTFAMNYKKPKISWYSSNAINWLQMLWGRKLALSDLFHFAVWGFALCQYSEQPAFGYLRGEVPGSQRCPREQPGYRQSARLCAALPATSPGASQAGRRAAWHQSRAVPVPRRIRVAGSGCAWPGWPPKPTAARELKGWGLLQCCVCSIMVIYPRFSHSGSNCGRNTQGRSLHL